MPVEPEPMMRNPTTHKPAPAAIPASAWSGAAAISPRNRWSFIAATVAILATMGLGLYALVHKAGDDTIMIALPQTPAKLPSTVAASARELDSSEQVAEVAPAASASMPSDPSAAPAPAALAAAPAAAPSKKAPAIEAKPPPPVVETVAYKLAIKPWGTVYVDGRERGVSPPMKRLTLPAGKHKIRIVNPGFPDYSINLESGKNKSAAIEHDFAAAKK
jgi:hypothetical protein